MMNYQYIEQLLERYWECQTSTEEEQILRTFFSQDNIPEQLRPYAPLFVYEAKNKQEETLSEDFTERVMAKIGEQTDNSKAKKHTVLTIAARRLAPLMKAAAVVAVVVAVGNISERSMQMNSVNPSGTDMTATDTYIRHKDITAKIKVIDKNKSEIIARTDSIFSHSTAVTTNETAVPTMPK